MTVEVHSAAGPFFVSSTHESLKTVSDKVLFLMRKRLVKWKSKKQQKLSLKELFYRLNYTWQKQKTAQVNLKKEEN